MSERFSDSQTWTPLAKIPGSAHELYVHIQSHQQSKQIGRQMEEGKLWYLVGMKRVNNPVSVELY